jgi:hypothetical protein
VCVCIYIYTYVFVYDREFTPFGLPAGSVPTTCDQRILQVPHREEDRSVVMWREAAVFVAVHRRRAVQERQALVGGPLVGASGDAVLAVVDAADVEAAARLLAEEVVRVGEVPEAGQRADALGDVAPQLVVRDVELLQAAHPGHGPRQLPLQLVEAEVQHGELAQGAELRREAGAQAGVEDDELVERAGHLGDAGGDAAAQVDVGEHEHRGRRVAEALRQLEVEVVVVEEDGVERLVEERGGHRPAEAVEAEVDVLDAGQAEDVLREPAREAVVAEVELVQEPQLGQRLRQPPREAVGVEVQQRQVGEEAQLLRERGGQVAVVEVEAGDGERVRVVRRRRAEHAVVAAHVGPAPAARHVLGVVRHGPLQRLQRHVRLLQARVVRRRLRRLAGGRRGEEEQGQEERSCRARRSSHPRRSLSLACNAPPSAETQTGFVRLYIG